MADHCHHSEHKIRIAEYRPSGILSIQPGIWHPPTDNIRKRRAADENAECNEDSGNDKVCLTERGVSFGYNTLVTDMRSFPQMAKDTGCPVIMDATHSVQQPGGLGGSSGGQREFAPVLARAAVAVGVAAVFIETHDNPDKALSDGPNAIPLKDMERVLTELMAYDKITKSMIHDY